jgi:WD40 repeat protein
MKMSLLMVALLGFCLDAPHCTAQEPKERANRDGRGEILCMAITADGRTLATGTWDRITLWNVAAWKELHTLKGHEFGCVAFSPDDKVLASGSRNKTIKFWDVATGKELRALTGHGERIASLVFSPDGKTLVSGSWDNTIKIWDAGTGKELRTIVGLGGRRCVTFSSDGRTLASDDRQTVILWSLDSGKERLVLKGHQESVFAVAFAPDGKTLASGGDDFTVKLWDAATGIELRTLKGHTDAIGSLAFTRDGKTLASGSNDGTAKLWDVATGKERATLRPKSDPKANRVHSVLFMAGGKTLVLGLMDGTVRFWDVTPATEGPGSK